MVTATKDAAVGHKIYLDGELKNSDTNLKNDLYATTRMISLGAVRGWTTTCSGHLLLQGRDRRGPHLQQAPDGPGD